MKKNTSLRQFDLNLLVLFEALITERHVSRAAEKVFLSQSAMSHALNRLRENLDDPLLIRTENGLQPTTRAMEMLPEVRAILRQIEQTLTPPEAFDAAQSQRKFRIACTDFFEAVIFPELICHFHEIAPNIVTEVEMIRENASQEALEDGSIDLVVGIDANDDIPEHLIVEHWLTERQVCLINNKEWPVKKSEMSVISDKLPEKTPGSDRVCEQWYPSLTLEEYISLPHVVFYDLAGSNISRIDDWLSRQQLQRHYIARTMNYMAAAKIVSQTNAIITLPYQMAGLFKSLFDVRQIQPPEGIPDIDMVMLSHPLYHQDPALIWLKQQIHLISRR